MEEGMAQRIRDLRKARGMTLEQVAKQVGVGKSTVRKWETGLIANMGQDKIPALAAALGTTPGYLMGCQDPSTPDQPLTQGEELLLELFRQIPEDKRQLVLQMIRAALETAK